MTTVAWLKPALRTPAKTLPFTARSSAHRAVAGEILGLLAASLTDGEGVPGALCRAAAFGPTRPLGVRRSSLSGDPTARTFPEMPRECAETASEAVAEVSARGWGGGYGLRA